MINVMLQHNLLHQNSYSDIKGIKGKFQCRILIYLGIQELPALKANVWP